MQRFTLETQATRLVLQDTQLKFNAITIDFNQMNVHWHQRHIGKNHNACKAIGLSKVKSDATLTVLDATAGLARDAFIFAKLGAEVTMLERHPILATMINGALQKLNDVSLKNKLHFIFDDALLYLQANTTLYDVIYLDPMFSELNKKAQVKREMQILQELVGQINDSADLLNLALKAAKKRVVVKRHKTAPWLSQHTPSHQIMGQSTRYDIYCCAPTPTTESRQE